MRHPIQLPWELTGQALADALKRDAELREQFYAHMLKNSVWNNPNHENMKTRLSLDFPAGSKDKLEELCVKSGASTMTEMFRRSVTYYEFLLDAEKRGFRIVLENPETGERETFKLV